jgi:2-polyprenyl-6-methoxyphenol hydroxylase-like FAD-dependent oxidoreductase
MGEGLALDHACMVDAMRRAVSSLPRLRLVRAARVGELLIAQGRVEGVRVEGSSEHRGALVIGADGRHSRIRKLLGIPTTVDLISHSAALTVPEDALPHPGRGHVFVDAPGPTLAYPCGRGRVRMCIDVPQDAARGPDRLRRFIRSRYVPALPEALARAVATELDKPDPLAGAANHVVTTTACAVRGAALVGDAGGCSHPITAAGMTNGLHDASTLAACVAERGLTDDALLEYQRRRYGFIRTREAFTRALYDILLAATPGTGELREGLFAYWRSGARPRAASTAILGADDERLSALVVEYARVVWAGAATSAARHGGAVRRGEFGAAIGGVLATLSAAGDALRTTIDKTSSALVLERSRTLLDAPASAVGRRPDRRPRERRAEDADHGAANAWMAVSGGDSVEQT